MRPWGGTLRAMRFDLHRHLEGSHSPRALLSVAKAFGVEHPLLFDAASGTYRDERAVAAELAMTEPTEDGSVFYDRIKKARVAYVSESAIAELARLAFEEASDEADRVEMRVSLFSMTRTLFENEGRTDWRETVAPAAFADRAARVLAGVLEARDAVQEARGHALPVRLGFSRTFESAPHYRALADMLRDHHAALCGLDVLGIVSGADREPLPSELLAILETLRPDLPDLTIHAGELMGPSSVERTLELAPRGIGHGVRSLESPALIERLAKQEVTLEVCPSSNALLIPSALARLRSRAGCHPLPALQRANVRCVLGSDDPVVFGTSFQREHQIAAHERADLARLEADSKRRWAQVTGEHC